VLVKPLSTLLSQALVAFTIELDNEFEQRFAEAGGGARVTSLTMWSTVLRFVGDGVTVREFVAAVGLPKQQALSRLGGIERWRYVSLDAAGPSQKREGYGSARGTKDEWEIRYTAAGERAAAIWPTLPDEIERRWRERFGAADVDQLAGALRAIDERVEVGLPDFLPVVGSPNGMALELPSVDERRAPEDLPLVVLLAHALMAYTLDFEQSAPLSLPLSANVTRVLDAEGIPVRELPGLTGISKEAVAASLTSLKRTPYVVVEGAPASKRTIRLTPAGEELLADGRRLHERIEEEWASRFGASVVRRLREALDRFLGAPALAGGLTPYPDGWRASKRYLQQTQAVLADPRGRLPHHPMVLHRGGWPDAS
jgi:DNA-binding MarR family transcriptional regulator